MRTPLNPAPQLLTDTERQRHSDRDAKGERDRERHKRDTQSLSPRHVGRTEGGAEGEAEARRLREVLRHPQQRQAAVRGRKTREYNSAADARPVDGFTGDVFSNSLLGSEHISFRQGKCFDSCLCFQSRYAWSIGHVLRNVMYAFIYNVNSGSLEQHPHFECEIAV